MYNTVHISRNRETVTVKPCSVGCRRLGFAAMELLHARRRLGPGTFASHAFGQLNAAFFRSFR